MYENIRKCNFEFQLINQCEKESQKDLLHEDLFKRLFLEMVTKQGIRSKFLTFGSSQTKIKVLLPTNYFDTRHKKILRITCLRRITIILKLQIIGQNEQFTQERRMWILLFSLLHISSYPYSNKQIQIMTSSSHRLP